VSWHQMLGAEISLMFREYSNREDEIERIYDARHARELEQAAMYRDRPDRRKKAVQRTKEWRQKNPERARSLGREMERRRRERLRQRDPQKYREWVQTRTRRKNEQVRTRMAADPVFAARMREIWARNQRAKREREQIARAA
jgi:hypothetical protein